MILNSASPSPRTFDHEVLVNVVHVRLVLAEYHCPSPQHAQHIHGRMAAVKAIPLRNPLHDAVRQSGLGFLQDETCHFRGFVLAETLVQNDEPCYLRVCIHSSAPRAAPPAPRVMLNRSDRDSSLRNTLKTPSMCYDITR